MLLVSGQHRPGLSKFQESYEDWRRTRTYLPSVPILEQAFQQHGTNSPSPRPGFNSLLWTKVLPGMLQVEERYLLWYLASGPVKSCRPASHLSDDVVFTIVSVVYKSDACRILEVLTTVVIFTLKVNQTKRLRCPPPWWRTDTTVSCYSYDQLTFQSNKQSFSGACCIQPKSKEVALRRDCLLLVYKLMNFLMIFPP